MWHWVAGEVLPSIRISTHTSRVGCDGAVRWPSQGIPKISTHTSRVGCDRYEEELEQWHYTFLLTHPVWDVTRSLTNCPLRCKFLLTHPVWDVTEPIGVIDSQGINFYSHIPCGMWPMHGTQQRLTRDFYSHIPCGMWHAVTTQYSYLAKISTHTSRVGCDADKPRRHPWRRHFYSHIPCGMWLNDRYTIAGAADISTHTSRVGCDELCRRSKGNQRDFYSHIPCGMWRRQT